MDGILVPAFRRRPAQITCARARWWQGASAGEAAGSAGMSRHRDRSRARRRRGRQAAGWHRGPHASATAPRRYGVWTVDTAVLVRVDPGMVGNSNAMRGGIAVVGWRHGGGCGSLLRRGEVGKRGAEIVRLFLAAIFSSIPFINCSAVFF